MREEVLTEPHVPMLGLFQNETWQQEYDDVPITEMVPCTEHS